MTSHTPRSGFRLLVPLIVLLCFAGCFRFGDNVELSGAAFTAAHLKVVSKATGITFPEGSVGIEYYYFGDTIDPSLAAKIRIPTDRKEEFLRNDIFKTGKEQAPEFGVGKTRPWWRIDTLKLRVDRAKTMVPRADLVECCVGEEAGALVCYINWSPGG